MEFWAEKARTNNGAPWWAPLRSIYFFPQSKINITPPDEHELRVDVRNGCIHRIAFDLVVFPGAFRARDHADYCRYCDGDFCFHDIPPERQQALLSISVGEFLQNKEGKSMGFG